jgi:hypothetical protein
MGNSKSNRGCDCGCGYSNCDNNGSIRDYNHNRFIRDYNHDGMITASDFREGASRMGLGFIYADIAEFLRLNCT